MVGIRILIAVIFTVCCTMAEARAQAGKSGMAFLRIGVDAHASALADAFSAAVSGAPSTFYNPAGLLSLVDAHSGAHLMLTHREWIQDTRVQFLGASIPLGNDHAIGFSLNSTTVGEVQIRTRPGPPEGTFTARNHAIGASYGHRVSRAIRAGITGKFLYEKILIDEASGFGLDLGVQVDTPLENLTAGAVLANVGRMGTLREERSKLPSLFRAGTDYRMEIGESRFQAHLVSEYQHLIPAASSSFGVGGELRFDRTVGARVGYQFGSEARGFSSGIGVLYGIFSFDYAFVPLSEDLDNTHAFTLTVRL